MVHPIKNNVLVKPFPSDEMSAGGIIVSEAHRPISNKMKVVAVGKGTKQTPMQFKAGDVVIRVRDCGVLIEMEGEKYFIIPQSWLLSKMN